MSQELDMWSMTLLISVCGVYFTKAEKTPVVTIEGHQIKGLQENGFAKYLGVPYAVVDKKNPFGPAVPHPSLSEVFEATESKKCPQLENNVVVGTLDCLTVDIYVPNIAIHRNHLPVMVWIRGDYQPIRTGPDDGSPNNLLHRNVIVVAINYRLDFYGFLCLDIPGAPGNQGLKDQVLALRWINKFIEAFQGNPKEITVFGSGLGGDYISLHLLSSYEKLFQRAIIQSGSAFSPLWAKNPLRDQIFLELVRQLGFNTSDINGALKDLSSVDANILLKKENYIKEIGTKPCIEKKLNGVENFITEHPSNIVSTKIGTIPVIIGYNDNEGAVWVNLIRDEIIPQYSFGDVLKFENLKNYLEAEEDAKQFYVGYENITENVKPDLINFVSDFFYGAPNQRMVDYLLHNKESTVYRYIFSYNGGRNLMKKQHNLNSKGATHGDELGYLLNYNELSGETTPEDLFMVDSMSNIWTHFAKFGNFIHMKTEVLQLVWNPTTKDNQEYLEINLKLSMKAMPTHKRMAFWVLFYKLYGETK